jgi:hypothetical protein
MILQALNDYYARQVRDSASGIPPFGFSEQKISFCIVLSAMGDLAGMVDLREDRSGKPKPKRLTVPASVIRTGNPVANFLWDNTGYVLGAGNAEKLERKLSTRMRHSRPQFSEQRPTPAVPRPRLWTLIPPRREPARLVRCATPLGAPPARRALRHSASGHAHPGSAVC